MIIKLQIRRHLLNLGPVIIAFIGIGLFDLPYGYYDVLRICCFLFFGLSSWYFLTLDATPAFAYIFILLGIVYNPIREIDFGRETWLTINILTIAFIATTHVLMKKSLDKGA